MAEVPKQIGELIAKNPNDKTRLQRELGVTDREIDQLVYELYGLTEDEINIVEEAASTGV